MDLKKEADVASKRADDIVKATSDAPVHSFDPNASPEAKAAAISKNMPENVINLKSKGAVGTELSTSNAEEVQKALAAAASKPVTQTQASTSAAAGPGKTADTPGHFPDAKKSVDSFISKIGWRDVGGLGNRDPSTLPPDVPPPRDIVSEFLSEAYFGQWWHNAAVILVAVTGTWLVTKIGGGLGHCLVIGAFLATYYQTSMRRVRRNARDDITREFAKSRLETDEETVDWLNNFLSRFWLIYEPVLSASIVQIADQILTDNTPSFLDSIRLSTFTLGTKAPRIGGVKTYPKVEPNEVVMDWKFNFTPTDTSDLTKRDLLNKVNPKIVLAIRVGRGFVGADIPVLLEDMDFQGNLRVKLRLMANFPHIKSVDISFLEPPSFDYVLKPIGGETLGFDINNIPGLAPFIREQVHASLGPMMYSPNVYTIDVEAMMTGGTADTSVGVLAVTVYSGNNLKNTELTGTSDPYVKFHINNRPEMARTSIKENTTSPRWNETYFLLLHNLNEVLSLEVMDYNARTKDKSMGIALFDLKKLESQEKHEDVSCDVTRNGKNFGALKCDFVFYPVSKEKKLADGTIEPALQSNTGIVRINIHQAQNLDPSKSMVGQYNPYAILKINGVEKFRTKKIKRSNNPTWEQSYESLVLDKENVMLDVQVMDLRDMSVDPVIGAWNMKLTNLLAANTGSAKQEWFSFKGVDGKVRITADWSSVLLTGAEHIMHGEYRPPIGVIRIKASKARDLKNVELMSGGKSDPYLRVLSVSQVRSQTQVIEDELNPVWDEIFYVPIHGIKEDLLLEVMDWQAVTKDRSLGVAELIVRNLIKETEVNGVKAYDAGQPFAGWVGLHSKDRKDVKGEVYYEASFFPTLKLAQEAKEEEEVEAEQGAAPTAEKPVISKDVDTAPLDSAPAVVQGPKKDVHGVSILTTPEGQIDLLKYQSGVLGVTIGEVAFPRQTEGYAEILLDSNEPLYQTNKTIGTTLQFDDTGDAFVKELDFAKITIRISQNTKLEKGSQIVASWSSDVISIVRSLTSLKEGDDGSMTVKMTNGGTLNVTFKYTPAIHFTLDPSESMENQGNLTVTALKCNNLHAADKSGTSDPYLTFTLNGEKVYKTEPVKKTLDPVFQNEQFQAPIASRSASKFSVEVFDWNQFSDKVSLGVAQIPLGGDNVPVNQAIEKTYNLTGPNAKGSITLRLVFKPELLQRKRTTTALGSMTKKLVGMPVGVVEGGAKVVETGVGGGIKVLEAGVGGIGSGLKATGSLLGLVPKKQQPTETHLPPPPADHTTQETVVTGTVPYSADGEGTHAGVSATGHQGELTIHLIEAKSLRAVDRGGTSDPYIKVKQQKHEVYKTQTVKKNLNPQWNESVRIPITSNSPPITLSIYDHNTIGTDEKLIDYELNIWEHLSDQTAVDKWIDLPEGNGQLHISLNFTPK